MLFFIYALQLDEERKGCIGKSEIVFALAEAKRQVRTSPEWSAAFRQTIRAVVFVFPHHREELESYAEYIENEFVARQSGAHAGSSSMIRPYITVLEGGRDSYSPISTNSLGSRQPSSMLTVSSMGVGQTELPQGVEISPGKVPPKQRSAKGSIVRKDVLSQMKIADTSIPVEDVEKGDMVAPTAQKTSEKGEIGSQPCYLHYNVWDPEAEFKPTTAEWMLTAEPLPRPPRAELTNQIVADTIEKNPDLFQVVTPIQVDVFERLHTSHPNRAFVDSLCLGFREGFWPWANTLYHDYPQENNQSRPTPSDECKAAFLRSQLEIERAKGCFSSPFGQNLRPGMYSMPIFAVPKPNSTDFQLVTNQSHEIHSLNSMIDHEKVMGYPFDNLSHLGQMLLDLEKREPNARKVVWKSDIAEAYQLIPMHPCWQIKQVNTIDGLRYVDHCNAFGGCIQQHCGMDREIYSGGQVSGKLCRRLIRYWLG